MSQTSLFQLIQRMAFIPGPDTLQPITVSHQRIRDGASRIRPFRAAQRAVKQKIGPGVNGRTVYSGSCGGGYAFRCKAAWNHTNTRICQVIWLLEAHRPGVRTGFRRFLAKNRSYVLIIHAICYKSPYWDKRGFAFLQVDSLTVKQPVYDRMYNACTKSISC